MMQTNSPKAASASGGGGGGTNKETPAGKNCSDVEEVSDEDTDDEDQIVETSQNGRWQKINVQVS